MAIQMRSFHNCCTAKVIYDFGGSVVAGGANWYRTLTTDQLIKEIGEKIDDAVDDNQAMVVVITNNCQKNANKALRHHGFKRTKWMEKEEHPETKVALWWLPLMEKTDEE